MPPTTVVLVLAPEIRVDGSPLPEADYDALVDLHVSRAIGVPSELTLRFSDAPTTSSRSSTATATSSARRSR
jgi:hypothetical protein